MKPDTASDLAASLKHPVKVHKGPRCGVGMLLREMPAADREALLKAMDNVQASGHWISNVLLEHGYKLSGFTINRHRRGECKCP